MRNSYPKTRKPGSANTDARHARHSTRRFPPGALRPELRTDPPGSVTCAAYRADIGVYPYTKAPSNGSAVTASCRSAKLPKRPLADASRVGAKRSRSRWPIWHDPTGAGYGLPHAGYNQAIVRVDLRGPR